MGLLLTKELKQWALKDEMRNPFKELFLIGVKHGKTKNQARQYACRKLKIKNCKKGYRRTKR